MRFSLACERMHTLICVVFGDRPFTARELKTVVVLAGGEFDEDAWEFVRHNHLRFTDEWMQNYGNSRYVAPTYRVIQDGTV